MALSGIQLRCPLEQCSTLKFTTAAAYAAGEMALVGACVGVVVEAVLTADIGDEAVLVYQAPKILVPCPAVASGDYGVGEKIYFDAADKEVNQSSGGNYMCGVVLEAPTAGDEEVLIQLDGLAVTVS